MFSISAFLPAITICINFHEIVLKRGNVKNQQVRNLPEEKMNRTQILCVQEVVTHFI